MSARRPSERPVALPSNPSFLDFTKSDGASSAWPTNTTRLVDHEGHVNFMQHLDLENNTVMKWRIMVGKALAIHLEMPEGPAYVLRNWPDGYRMFDHHKGPAANPRHDVYLFGSPRGRFRSINEFIPHAIWLMSDGLQRCNCKYCSKTAQKLITATINDTILRSTPGNSPSPSQGPRPARDKGIRPRDLASKNREQRQREPKVYAAIQRIPKPIKPSPHVTKHTMPVERNQDLRAIHSNATMKLKRWFREGELLWCALNPPIPGPEGDNEMIKFWPGIVDEVRLKTQPVPRADVSTSQHGSPMQEGATQSNSIDKNATNEENSTPWTIHQYTVYKMHLLAVNRTVVISDEQVLPYQAYVPPSDLIAAMQAFPPSKLDFESQRMMAFDPCPDTHPANFSDAVAPFAMAVQIASLLSGFWCLTDDWEFKYISQSDISTAPPSLPPPPPQSLETAIQAATLNNSSDGSGPNGHLPSQHSPDSIEPEISRAPERTRTPTPLPVTQRRFQGLWWGAERIWIDEFVRLKIPRRCLAPKGAENILRPSGPGKAAREEWEASGRDPTDLGAGTRGAFMRLDGLFVVDIQKDGKTKQECRACGMLYELADLDWEDPDNRDNTVPTANGVASTQTSNENMVPKENPSTISAPLPIIPSTLPNFDPSVPVASTTSSMLAQVSPDSEPLPPPKTQLSHPVPSSHYLPPLAPQGYRFRPILAPGYQVIISLSLISGRYYPRILSHPLLDSALQQAMLNPLEEGGLMKSNNLWALEGLSAGFYNSVDPTLYKESRPKMLSDADAMAAGQLEAHKVARLAEEQEAEKARVEEMRRAEQEKAVGMLFDDDDEEIDQLSYPMEVDG